MITSCSNLESLKSQDIVDVRCSRCNNTRQTKVASLRYYFRHLCKTDGYICHRCKAIENGKLIGDKLKKKAREKGYVVTDRTDAICEDCKRSSNITIKVFRANKKRNGGIYRCIACSMQIAHKEGKFNKIYTDEFKNKLNEESKKFWEISRNTWKERLVTDEFRKQMSIYGKRAWTDEYRKKILAIRLDPEYKKKSSEWGKLIWTNDEFRQKMIELGKLHGSRNGKLGWQKRMQSKTMEEISKELSTYGKMAWTKEFRERKAIEMSNLWKDDEFKNAMILKMSDISDELWNDKEYRDKTLAAIERLWSDPTYYAKMVKLSKQRWSDPVYREKMAVARLNQSKTSFQQKILYSMLADLGVEYLDDQSPLCKIGYYLFDCRINPQLGIMISRPLLIEVQGDYWHNLPKAISRDRSKATYLRTYFPEFDLKYLWEHEFDNKDRVRDLLKYWLGLSKPNLKQFNFGDVVEKIIDYKEAELFISKYHYAGKVGRSGINLGYFIEEELIAVIIYSSPVRQEIAIKQGCAYKEILELSRLAIHPEYQIKNLASHLISRSINHIKINKPEIKILVSFADSTYNHSGTIYKASNWILDGETSPDYWYADDRGYICHKKTLWNKAKKNGLTESEYCDINHYSKIWGDKKYRYIYHIGS